MTEGQIQSAIKRKLEREGWFVTKIIQCSTNGFPDLMALKDGKAMFIECKRPGQKPTALQQYRIKQLKENGFEVIVATNTNYERQVTQFCKEVHKGGDKRSSNG